MDSSASLSADDHPDPAVNGHDPELKARAEQIANLTWRQHQAIRVALIAIGLPKEVASNTAWLAADPQHMLDQLKRPRREVLAVGVTGVTVQTDTLIAPLLRAAENVRMSDKRYEGTFSLPRYGTANRNAACVLDLRHYGDHQAGLAQLEAGIGEIDAVIDANNKYGADIAENGVRVGGILFPLLVDLTDKHLLGGWETADCYGRTYFVQQSENIELRGLLDQLWDIPTTRQEFNAHPMQARRARLLSVAGKVTNGTPVTAAERSMLIRAVMPSTKMVLAVEGAPMAEARRRIVAQQHLDRPTPFSSDTQWQTRAEAVLEALEQKERLVAPPDANQAQVRLWLDAPAKAVDGVTLYPDDIAVLAAATLLPATDTAQNRAITTALRTRGVMGTERKEARSMVAAHVIARAIPAKYPRDGRRSALERVLRLGDLRGIVVDTRPIADILADARCELDKAGTTKSEGEPAMVGSATKQILMRAGFYLTCGVGESTFLERSAYGAVKGKAQEPGELLRKLAKTKEGLEQLAQAIFDGRRQYHIRLVEKGQLAVDTPSPADESGRMTPAELRDLALAMNSSKLGEGNGKGEQPKAAAVQVREDTDDLRSVVGSVEETVRVMRGRKDSIAPEPHVDEHGWMDPLATTAPESGIVYRLRQVADDLHGWSLLHKKLNGSGPTSEVAG
ncbi:hypothetical protein GCM10009665_01570 [Kitasatospora nipponensis]|uniref:Uncharacterized protein n=1 Tax=Kitasatospora nipponensis TaxID=258049 RepID=A0ABN1VKN3_9ACTN